MQGAQDSTGGVAFRDDAVAGCLAVALHQRIDRGVVQGAHDNIHPLGHQRVREGAQLPIAQVRGRKQNSPALSLGFGIVLQSLVTNPLGNVPGV